VDEDQVGPLTIWSLILLVVLTLGFHRRSPG